MSEYDDWKYSTVYADKGVEVRTEPVCTDCTVPMVKSKEYDSYSESQEFECPECGKTVGVYVPTSGDVF